MLSCLLTQFHAFKHRHLEQIHIIQIMPNFAKFLIMTLKYENFLNFPSIFWYKSHEQRKWKTCMYDGYSFPEERNVITMSLPNLSDVI